MDISCGVAIVFILQLDFPPPVKLYSNLTIPMGCQTTLLQRRNLFNKKTQSRHVELPHYRLSLLHSEFPLSKFDSDHARCTTVVRTSMTVSIPEPILPQISVDKIQIMITINIRAEPHHPYQTHKLIYLFCLCLFRRKNIKPCTIFEIIKIHRKLRAQI